VSVWIPPAPESWVDFNAPAAAALAPGWMLYNASIFTVPVLARAGSVIPLLPRNLSSTLGISGQAYVVQSLAPFHLHPTQSPVLIRETDTQPSRSAVCLVETAAAVSTFMRTMEPAQSARPNLDIRTRFASYNHARYLSGVSATTRLQFKQETGNCDTYNIQTLGYVVYDGMIRQRSYALEIMYGSGKPLSVSQNERVLAEAGQDGIEGTWFAHANHTAVYLNKCDAFDLQMVLVCT
jgi:hypothetical protein